MDGKGQRESGWRPKTAELGTRVRGMRTSADAAGLLLLQTIVRSCGRPTQRYGSTVY